MLLRAWVLVLVFAGASGNVRRKPSVPGCGDPCGNKADGLCTRSEVCQVPVRGKNECQDPCLCCTACESETSKQCSRYEGGQCSSSCGDNQRVIAKACKAGSNCVCCADPCRPTRSCTDAQGLCVDNDKACLNGKLDPKGCVGRDCKCCIPNSCEGETSKQCSRYEGGQCSSSCGDNQRVIAKACKAGSDCVCCADPCRPTRSCTDAQGFCVDNDKACLNGKLDPKGCISTIFMESSVNYGVESVGVVNEKNN
nr:prestalk protein-like [Procambarus clarkii]